jgi:hypothetical protein
MDEIIDIDNFARVAQICKHFLWCLLAAGGQAGMTGRISRVDDGGQMD